MKTNGSLGTINRVRVPVEVVLGSTDLDLEALAALSEGTIVELESLAGEPVEVRAAGTVIAKGEVVVIDENFGVRITALLDR